jgi:hypothetical protein
MCDHLGLKQAERRTWLKADEFTERPTGSLECS